MEVERDVLVETGKVLFRFACERYLEKLQASEVKQDPDLNLRRRTGEKACENLSVDIVYMFATGMVDSFPRTVLRNTSKYVENTWRK